MPTYNYKCTKCNNSEDNMLPSSERLTSFSCNKKRFFFFKCKGRLEYNFVASSGNTFVKFWSKPSGTLNDWINHRKKFDK